MGWGDVIGMRGCDEDLMGWDVMGMGGCDRDEGM